MFYAKLSNEDRVRLFNCHLEVDNYSELDKHLGIKRQSVYSILRKAIVNGGGGLRRSRYIINDMIKNCVVDVVDENHELTLEQINPPYVVQLLQEYWVVSQLKRKNLKMHWWE